MEGQTNDPGIVPVDLSLRSFNGCFFDRSPAVLVAIGIAVAFRLELSARHALRVNGLGESQVESFLSEAAIE